MGGMIWRMQRFNDRQVQRAVGFLRDRREWLLAVVALAAVLGFVLQVAVVQVLINHVLPPLVYQATQQSGITFLSFRIQISAFQAAGLLFLAHVLVGWRWPHRDPLVALGRGIVREIALPGLLLLTFGWLV